MGFRIADVAQLVEQLICNHQVGGSNPFVGSRIAAAIGNWVLGVGIEDLILIPNYQSLMQCGEVPEWPKGTGCKPVGFAYGGSNPPLSTSNHLQRI